MQTLVSAAYVVSWSRDGQTLVVGRTKPDATGLVALSPVRADFHQVTLTTSISIFLGFVRTA